MALIKCSKCAGTVSTKAAACPHCGTARVDKWSDEERLEQLANELGSISAAIAADEERARAEPEKTKVHAPENAANAGSRASSMPTYMGILAVLGVLLRLWVWADKEAVKRKFSEEHNRNMKMIEAGRELAREIEARSQQAALESFMASPKSNGK